MSTAHGSSFFSSIGAALHKLPLSPPGSIFAASSKRGLSGICNFEANLTERIASLKPASETEFLSLSWLGACMSVVLSSHSAVENLIAELEQSPLARRDEKWVSEFLDESAKLLDVCNGLREILAKMEESQMLLQLVLQNLNITVAGVTSFSERQLQRAKKALLDFQELVCERQENLREQEFDLSWLERGSVGTPGRLFSLDRRRSNSWGGTAKEKVTGLQRLQSKAFNGSTACTVKEGDDATAPPVQQQQQQQQESLAPAAKTVLTKKAADHIPEIELLKSMTEKFGPPKGIDASRGRNAFIVAMYAAKVTTVCVLGVVYVALKSKACTNGLTLLMSCSSQISRHFNWAPPLLDLLEGVALEVELQRRQTKLTSFLSDLPSILASTERLLTLIEGAQARGAFPLRLKLEGKMCEELADLRQQVEVFDQSLGHLEEQVNELFRILIASRTQLLDILGKSIGPL